MLAPERRSLILEEVKRNKSVVVKDLCGQFRVSGETIRKDLALLEKQGQLIKTHGGAYIEEGVHNEVHAQIRRTIYTKAKSAIGKACAAMVHSGETVMLDESTTSLHIARELAGIHQLTVLTNSLQIVSELAGSEEVRVVLFGGQLSHRNLSVTGGETVEMISRYYADRAFVSCRGLAMHSGMTDGSEEGGLVRRTMLAHAQHRILVVDGTKFDHTHLYRIAGFDGIDQVVTDKLPEGWNAFLESKGIPVVEALPMIQDHNRHIAKGG